jgi:hypothetical protein
MAADTIQGQNTTPPTHPYSSLACVPLQRMQVDEVFFENAPLDLII